MACTLDPPRESWLSNNLIERCIDAISTKRSLGGRGGFVIIRLHTIAAGQRSQVSGKRQKRVRSEELRRGSSALQDCRGGSTEGRRAILSARIGVPGVERPKHGGFLFSQSHRVEPQAHLGAGETGRTDVLQPPQGGCRGSAEAFERCPGHPAGRRRSEEHTSEL